MTRKTGRPYHAISPQGLLQRQQETAEKLLKSSIDLFKILLKENLQHRSTWFFSFTRNGGFCRQGSYSVGNSPPSSYSSSCPSVTSQNPLMTSPCDRLLPLRLLQHQYKVTVSVSAEQPFENKS